MSRKFLIFVTAVLVAAAATAVMCRILFYQTGYIYNEYQLNFLSVTGIGLIAAAVFTGYRAYRIGLAHPHPAPIGSIGGAINTAALVLTLLISLFAFGAIVLPVAPIESAAKSCRGTPTAGAPAYGQTGSVGVNARSGPGSDYEPVNRFASDCTLGFDGFCLGEVINDPRSPTQLPDQRWLILHNRNELVSAAYIRLQSKRSDLGTKPSAKCKNFGGVVGPTSLTWTATAKTDDKIRLLSTSPGAAILGFAIRYPPSVQQQFDYALVGKYSPLPGVVSGADDGEWDVSSATPQLARQTFKVVAVGEACYADDAPAFGTARYKELTIVAGRLIAARNISPPIDAARLERVACSIV